MFSFFEHFSDSLKKFLKSWQKAFSAVLWKSSFSGIRRQVRLGGMYSRGATL